jgi:hypothetical protein
MTLDRAGRSDKTGRRSLGREIGRSTSSPEKRGDLGVQPGADVSEYQYYEFRAIDHPLDEKQMDELRALSTRAEITPTSLTNTYHWGDFKGNPATLMDRYFDAFVYVANWGTHRLMFRIPRKFLDVEAASAYCDDEVLTLDAKNDHVVFEFLSQEEGGGEWEEGEQYMPSLISVRAELMRGDYRALYLGWLASIQYRDPDDEEEGEESELEPPVPPGLAKLSAPLRALADFLRINDELIEVAAKGSSGEAPAEPSREELTRWIKKLPTSAKDDSLLRFLSEEGDLILRAELLRQFREATLPGAKTKPAAGRRTVAQLLSARDAYSKEKSLAATERQAIERAKRQKAEAEARSKYLDELTGRENEIWSEVETLIATKLPKSYDRAVTLLVDLRDLAQRSGTQTDFERRAGELRERHRAKSSLLKRFQKVKL